MKEPHTKSGKCGDTVWQRNRYGQISYAAFTPANPRSPAQVAVRGVLTAVSKRWRTLTQEQRDAWNAAAQTIQSKPHLGQSGPLTGCQLLVMINVPLAYSGRNQVDMPGPYPCFPSLAVSSLSVSNVAGVIKITLACPNDPGDYTILRASAPLSAGRNTCTHFRIIGACPSPDEGSADITALYTARFGVPRVGSKLFLQANQIIAGWADEPVEFSFVVPAPQPEPLLISPVQSRAGVSPAHPCASTLPPASTDPRKPADPFPPVRPTTPLLPKPRNPHFLLPVLGTAPVWRRCYPGITPVLLRYQRRVRPSRRPVLSQGIPPFSCQTAIPAPPTPALFSSRRGLARAPPAPI